MSEARRSGPESTAGAPNAGPRPSVQARAPGPGAGREAEGRSAPTGPPTAHAPPRRSRVRLALQLAVSAAFVALLLSWVDLGEVGRILAAADPLLLALAVVGAFLDRLLMAWKWMPLLRVHVPGARLLPALRAYLAAGAASYFLPSTVGADALRAAAVGAGRGAVMEVGASIVMERVLGLLSNALVAAAALALGASLALPVRPLLLGALLLLLVPVIALAVLFFEGPRRVLGRAARAAGDSPWMRLVHRFGAAFTSYRGHPGTVAWVAALTLAEQLVTIVLLWVASLALHEAVPFVALLVSAPVAVLVTRLPFAFAGIGPGDATLIYLLGLFGVPTADAFALAVVARALEIAVAIPGVFLWGDLVDGVRGVRREGART